jgi:hypothetical protein
LAHFGEFWRIGEQLWSRNTAIGALWSHNTPLLLAAPTTSTVATRKSMHHLLMNMIFCHKRKVAGGST